jgi:hypothetical protein
MHTISVFTASLIYAFSKNPPSYADIGYMAALDKALQRFAVALQAPYYRPPSTLQVGFFALQVERTV